MQKEQHYFTKSPKVGPPIWALCKVVLLLLNYIVFQDFLHRGYVGFIVRAGFNNDLGTQFLFGPVWVFRLGNLL